MWPQRIHDADSSVESAAFVPRDGGGADIAEMKRLLNQRLRLVGCHLSVAARSQNNLIDLDLDEAPNQVQIYILGTARQC